MTDVPRRSYPLVVAPPGGFDDAVRRGRRLRRRRAGGSTGAALMVVGAITFASLGSDGGTNGLRPTREAPHHERTAPAAPVATASVSPEPSPSAVTSTKPRAGSRPVAGVATTTAPAPPPPPAPTPDAAPESPRPRRGSTTTSRSYAQRAPIEESGPSPSTSTDTQCLSTGADWCADVPSVYPTTQNGVTRYELTYTLCRAVDAGTGTIRYNRAQRTDFATTHKATNDTVWTYSAGQRVRPADTTLDVPAGYCVSWVTVWDGYDDFGHTPPGGTYVLTASPFGVSDTPLPTKTTEFDIN